MALYDEASNRKWTAGELIIELSKLPPETRVLIEDADTSWTIPVFSIRHEPEHKRVWIEPCNYPQMSSTDNYD